MSDGITRRELLAGAAGTLGASAAETKTLPARVLGRTGMRASILAIGCGSRLFSYKNDDQIIEALHLAMDCGITYMDCAQAYGGGRSETLVGQAIQGRRDKLIVATKTQARTADEVMRRAELSLKKLQVNQIDVFHIHELLGPDDLARVEAKDGAVAGLYKLRDQKIARAIGITCHGNPEGLAQALERHDFDCVQMALNAALQGQMPNWYGYLKKKQEDIYSEALPPVPRPGNSFQERVLPIAVRKKMGVIAMKVTGQEGLIGPGPSKASASDLIRYALSLPVSVVTVGMPRLEFVRENTDLARNFTPMPADQMRALAARISSANKVALDLRFRHHRDC
jgi:uncharacterized protein